MKSTIRKTDAENMNEDFSEDFRFSIDNICLNPNSIHLFQATPFIQLKSYLYLN